MCKPVSSSWYIRPLGLPDVDKAVDLYRQSFEQETAERNWTQRDFIELLASPGVFGFLLLRTGTPSGFLLARAVADEAEILTIAVLMPCRRQGGAERLLRETLATARGRGARAVFLEVSEDNKTAIQFYIKQRFREVGRRPQYYGRRGVAATAAIVMRRDIQD